MAIKGIWQESPREKGEGLRIGTVLRSPRAVPKSEYALRDIRTHFSTGCYCAGESRCQRSVLRELLHESRAELH